jgi:hypothetical protein
MLTFGSGIKSQYLLLFGCDIYKIDGRVFVKRYWEVVRGWEVSVHAGGTNDRRLNPLLSLDFNSNLTDQLLFLDIQDKPHSTHFSCYPQSSSCHNCGSSYLVIITFSLNLQFVSAQAKPRVSYEVNL